MIIKRIMDIIVSLIGLIVLSPLFLIIFLWIKLTSKGPIIYKHERLGKDHRVFNVYKFRSMFVGARDMQKEGVSSDKLKTSTGIFIRKAFLDEILQLINVLKGDMSLVGPRPYDKEDKKKLNIKPGMTGIQALYNYLPNKEKDSFIQEHFGVGKDFDSFYEKNRSFFLDMKIIFYTIIVLIKRMFTRASEIGTRI
ncbi:sugar transferase [Candidatus Woesearchaeota archaeon]|nr:sugar transferase [Candidatus Woesearchaeota archaeon]